MNYKFLILLLSMFYEVSSVEKILHLTDIHIDLNYHIGSPNKCYIGTKLGTGCCNKFDIPLSNSEKCTKWGDPQLNNDLPIFLFNNILEWIKSNIPDISAIFQTGDDCSHKDITQTPQYNLKTIKYVNDRLTYYFKNISIYNALGNHDTYPIDNYLPYLYKYMLKSITNYWFNNSEHSYGYYSIPFNKDIQIVSINSIYYDVHNFYKITNDNQDSKLSNSQMKWIKTEFIKAKNTNKKIILLNHIPIFGSESTPYYNNNLISILDKFKDTLLIHLNGHEHSDHFYLYKKKNSSNISTFSLIPNSLVTSNNFPGFRVYYLDTNTSKFINYIQYTCNITSSIKNDKLDCYELYDFRNMYNLNEISANTFEKIYENFKKNITLFNQYLYYMNFGQQTINKCLDYNCVSSGLNNILYEF